MDLTINFNEVFLKLKKLFLKPRVFFRDAKKEKGLREALAFLIVVSGIGSIFGFLGNFISPLKPIEQFGVPTVLVFSVVAFLMGIFLVFIFGGVTLLVLKLFRTKTTFDKVFQLSAYAVTPAALLSWVPYVGLLAFLWTFILLFLGVRAFYDFSKLKATIFTLIFVVGYFAFAYLLLYLSVLGRVSYG